MGKLGPERILHTLWVVPRPLVPGLAQGIPKAEPAKHVHRGPKSKTLALDWIKDQ